MSEPEETHYSAHSKEYGISLRIEQIRFLESLLTTGIDASELNSSDQDRAHDILHVVQSTRRHVESVKASGAKLVERAKPGQAKPRGN